MAESNHDKKHISQGVLSFIQSNEIKTELFISFFLYALIYVFLASAYQHINIFPDSSGYIQSAKHFFGLGIRPQGYSSFLFLIHSISPSEKLLFLSQFVLNAFSTLLLYFVVLYFFRPSSRIHSRLVLFLMIINPGVVYLSTWILSDSLFTSLTMLWFASAIIAVKKNNTACKIAHLFLMFFILQTRGVGLMYPIITAMFLFFSSKSTRSRLIWAAVPLLILFVNIEGMKLFNRKATGVSTFSGFSGWTIANNAMHIIPYIDMNAEIIDDEDIKIVHQRVLKALDTNDFHSNRLHSKFIWRTDYPLKKMLYETMEQRNFDFYTGWNYMSVPFKKYAFHLIRGHPGEFFKHFIAPNTKMIFSPYLGIYGANNQAKGSLTPVKTWFGLENNDFEKTTQESQAFRQVKALIMRHWNKAIFIVSFISLLLLATMRFRISTNARSKIILFGMIGWVLIYLALSVFAAVIYLRYLCPVYPILMLIIYIVINEKLQNLRLKSA